MAREIDFQIVDETVPDELIRSQVFALARENVVNLARAVNLERENQQLPAYPFRFPLVGPDVWFHSETGEIYSSDSQKTKVLTPASYFTLLLLYSDRSVLSPREINRKLSVAPESSENDPKYFKLRHYIDDLRRALNFVHSGSGSVVGGNVSKGFVFDFQSAGVTPDLALCKQAFEITHPISLERWRITAERKEIRHRLSRMDYLVRMDALRSPVIKLAEIGAGESGKEYFLDVTSGDILLKGSPAVRASLTTRELGVLLILYGKGGKWISRAEIAQRLALFEGRECHYIAKSSKDDDIDAVRDRLERVDTDLRGLVKAVYKRGYRIDEAYRSFA